MPNKKINKHENSKHSNCTRAKKNEEYGLEILKPPHRIDFALKFLLKNEKKKPKLNLLKCEKKKRIPYQFVFVNRRKYRASGDKRER